MSDRKLRELERLAADGDPEAMRALAEHWKRSGGPEEWVS